MEIIKNDFLDYGISKGFGEMKLPQKTLNLIVDFIEYDRKKQLILNSVVVSCDKKEKKLDRVDINQKVTQASFLDGTFYVETNVWVNDGKGSLLTLEDRQFACVKPPLIDSIKTKQLKRAVLIKKKLMPMFSN